MRENRVKTIWREGGTVLNGWLHIPTAYTAELMAHGTLDSLTIDMQHGPIDRQVVLAMMQAISTTDVTPVVRVPSNDPAAIMHALDSGAYGVICPMVNTLEDAEAFVGACRYPPLGYRSVGPFRATTYAGGDYLEHANDTVVTLAQIETKEALENLDEILGVPGLDCVFVGPSDLAQTLGEPAILESTGPQTLRAVDHILAAARDRGVAAGIFAGPPEHAARMVEKGFQFVTVLADDRLLAAAADAVAARVRGTTT